jgi:four helix bundle protein
MDFSFEKLRVYRAAQDFNLQMQSICKRHHLDSHPALQQMSRAALSIPLNIAEGYGRFSAPDKRRFYRIALGSAYECVPNLKVFEIYEFIDAHTHATLRDDLARIGASLINLINQS